MKERIRELDLTRFDIVPYSPGEFCGGEKYFPPTPRMYESLSSVEILNLIAIEPSLSWVVIDIEQQQHHHETAAQYPTWFQ